MPKDEHLARIQLGGSLHRVADLGRGSRSVRRPRGRFKLVGRREGTILKKKKKLTRKKTAKKALKKCEKCRALKAVHRHLYEKIEDLKQRNNKAKAEIYQFKTDKENDAAHKRALEQGMIQFESEARVLREVLDRFELRLLVEPKSENKKE